MYIAIACLKNTACHDITEFKNFFHRIYCTLKIGFTFHDGYFSVTNLVIVNFLGYVKVN